MCWNWAPLDSRQHGRWCPGSYMPPLDPTSLWRHGGMQDGEPHVRRVGHPRPCSHIISFANLLQAWPGGRSHNTRKSTEGGIAQGTAMQFLSIKDMETQEAGNQIATDPLQLLSIGAFGPSHREGRKNPRQVMHGPCNPGKWVHGALLDRLLSCVICILLHCL